MLVIGGGPLGCELAQAFCRFGAQTTIVQEIPMFLPKEERDAAQTLSDAFARDGIEVRLNTKAVNVRVEHGLKLVDLVSEDYHSTVLSRHSYRHWPAAEHRRSQSGNRGSRLRGCNRRSGQ
jgi:pyruvate/2-oxoglutarate dehydrogenase complex dihydrolipoamide dehydrogenase (E3) component